MELRGGLGLHNLLDYPILLLCQGIVVGQNKIDLGVLLLLENCKSCHKFDLLKCQVINFDFSQDQAEERKIIIQN